MGVSEKGSLKKQQISTIIAMKSQILISLISATVILAAPRNRRQAWWDQDNFWEKPNFWQSDSAGGNGNGNVGNFNGNNNFGNGNGNGNGNTGNGNGNRNTGNGNGNGNQGSGNGNGN